MIQTYKKKKSWTETLLQKFYFVKWDRFTQFSEIRRFYGWIDRPGHPHGYKDFIVLEVWEAARDCRLISCSNVKYQKVISRILGRSIKLNCQRIENHFKINNAIEAQ